MNFHALPLPGHVSSSEHEANSASQPEMDSLSQLVVSTAPQKVSTVSTGPAFFITEGDTGLAEEDHSDDLESTDDSSSEERGSNSMKSRVAHPVPVSSSVPSTARSKLSDKMDSARSARTEQSARAPLTQRFVFCSAVI